MVTFRFLDFPVYVQAKIFYKRIIMSDLKIIEVDEYKLLVSDAESIVKQLGGFIKKLHST
ncbi:MAG: hypothetical protein A2725_00785 [Candidatus Magasanikbacteria bacterium RIFCSPHIGHO2_01_FULL_33_34]|uniref:Uncharacterized protein n=1 Tax=Candidatus Magasanikbacteria bacterium RIFCSPHIGHO2_01_FULL_33_34 TaxID=1798671 RepID=A0A1F6LJ38_9BACT|nr:MAG: hypothetical protein A2725_00785 [Candidatus Magasanikbacteria bacterium RIFCSPHIGHO2_01_FULL_33_34]OGH65293.1 MAG: hypothetical protein A3B83_04445 [Candidatus Magasanikbacteria bacterium RIFCSPHIGHO2_02_FULL_33_17]OGH76070.1 MAG: hypothetical protein A3A89_01370 [Candidatus Magasanikbacteria bacterium RIFCSPLOWO2_01_FULL_33_34]OGH81759.1 MAG: hypothetical protein A3F93_00790 [Candidatus Magasanikbacteria bacterium RIFCSPLOWO2_12_FULL_34_7]